MSKVSVILLAGGIGSRIGGAIPKQFLPLEEKPIALHSYAVFRSIPEVDEIIIVCDPKYQHYFPDAIFALPGTRRQDSVYNGLQETSNEIVCIHDAARPFINRGMVLSVIEAAKKHGAATVGMPVKFTVKQSDPNLFVSSTPDRSTMWEVQTPQVIKRDLLIEGFNKVNEENLTVTDDVSIVELLGHPVKLVEGAYTNIKITTPEDLSLAKELTKI